MKKRMISILLVSVLTLSMISGCGNKNTTNQTPEDISTEGITGGAIQGTTGGADGEMEDLKTLEEGSLGFKFDLPAAWYKGFNETNSIQIENYQHAMLFSVLSKAGRDKMTEIEASMAEGLGPNGYTEEQQKLLEELGQCTVPICAIMATEDESEEDADLVSKFTDRKDLGTVDGAKYTLLYNKEPDTSEIAEQDLEDFKALNAEVSEIEKNIQLLGLGKHQDIAGEVSFNTKTLDGTEVSSDIFKDYKLTMINVWATWCGPCVEEIPELEELYKDLPEGVNLISLCTDGETENELAKQIIDKSGVTYNTLVVNEEMNKGFVSSLQSLPTTIFVDSNGNMVGEPIVGAPKEVVEGYKQAIEERLQQLDE